MCDLAKEKPPKRQVTRDKVGIKKPPKNEDAQRGLRGVVNIVVLNANIPSI